MPLPENGDGGNQNARFKRFRLTSVDSLTKMNEEEPAKLEGLKRLQRQMSAPVLGINNPQKLRKTSKPEGIKANLGNKNGNMVLQLVLPSVGIHEEDDDIENNNYLTASSVEEILGGSGSGAKRRNNTGSDGSQHELYSNISAECYVNQGYSNDLADYGSGFSLDSVPQSPTSATSSDKRRSTSAQEKNRNFREYLTKILSSMYALFIVTLGLVVYISDVIVDSSPIAETFSLYLVIVALVFVLYLIIDVRIYMKKKNAFNDLMMEEHAADDIEMKECSSTGQFHLNITLPKVVKKEPPQHYYCLSRDRHAANFYLKIGAAGFCVGHLIHSGLLLGYQILFLTTDGEGFYECVTVTTLVLDIIYPIYSFLLLYFIFKYSNVIINRHMPLVRFGLMHCISSSLCFWVWTIFRETIQSLSNHQHEEEENDDGSGNDSSEDTTKISEVAFYTGSDELLPMALPLTSYNKKGAQLLTGYLNTSVRMFSSLCRGDEGLSLIYQNYSPYLYPFSVEYSILVVGVLFVIWQSIGKCKQKRSEQQPEEMSNGRGQQPQQQNHQPCDSPEGNCDNLESNVVIHADCHSANKGLFGGIVIMVVTVVSIILFFIAINDDNHAEVGVFVNMVTSICITLLMTITGILAYRQITKLDFSNEHLALLDDLLLFVPIPAFFLNGIFSIIPAVLNKSALSIAMVFLEVSQVLVQTPLIIDGLRRCSNTRELRREKPGRELLTFLIVCNVAMWITQTFQVKSYGLLDRRYEFYGKELWTIIGHMCIPFMMFYRFHSSVCIVDIWKYAYEPAGSH